MVREYKKEFPVLPYRFKLVVYDKPSELLDKYPNMRFQHDVRDFQGGCMEFEEWGYILIHKSKNLNHGHISHECKHLVNFAFRYAGIELDVNNDETECYFLSWLVNQVYKHISL